MSTPLPPIDDRVLPAEVRNGAPADKTRYKTALQFERELVSQLTEQLAQTTTPDSGDESSSTAASTTTYRQMLPGVLADSVMQSGGLGLARQIAQNLKETGQ
jgi:Rod binding domain-containing protein